MKNYCWDNGGAVIGNGRVVLDTVLFEENLAEFSGIGTGYGGGIGFQVMNGLSLLFANGSCYSYQRVLNSAGNRRDAYEGDFSKQHGMQWRRYSLRLDVRSPAFWERAKLVLSRQCREGQRGSESQGRRCHCV